MNNIMPTSSSLETLFKILDPNHVEYLAPMPSKIEGTASHEVSYFRSSLVDSGLKTLQIALVRQQLELDPELIRAKNKRGRTVLHEVAYRGADWMIPILVSAGANLDAKDDHGRTPLMEAVFQAEDKVAKRLMSLGASS